MKNIKVVVFDFDGTIADSLPMHFNKIISLAKERFSVDKKEKEIIEEIKNKSYFELMKFFKISWIKIPMILGIIKESQKQLYLQVDKIKIFPGIKKLLKGLKNNNYQIGILSSNMQRNVNKFLRTKKLNFFDIVYCESNILGKDKTIKKMMRKYNLKPEEIIYVGDEIRDIEACKKVGVNMIGVSWGLHTIEALKKNGVNFIINKPHEILNLIKD